jgi:hypothetical protein
VLERGFIPPDSRDGMEFNSPALRSVCCYSINSRVSRENQMTKRVPLVPKDQFDALLGKLMSTPPQPAKTIKTEGKLREIIPSTPPPPKPHKA